MARVKPKEKLPQLASWDEVDLALAEICEHQRAAEAIAARMQEAIDEAKLEAKDASAPHLEAIDSLSQQVREYAERERESIGRKTKALMFGSLGWRKSTKIGLPRNDGLLAQLAKEIIMRGWLDCVKQAAPKIDRDALRLRPHGELQQMGVTVQVEDVFWLETNRDAIPPAD